MRDALSFSIGYHEPIRHEVPHLFHRVANRNPRTCKWMREAGEILIRWKPTPMPFGFANMRLSGVLADVSHMEELAKSHYRRHKKHPRYICSGVGTKVIDEYALIDLPGRMHSRRIIRVSFIDPKGKPMRQGPAKIVSKKVMASDLTPPDEKEYMLWPEFGMLGDTPKANLNMAIMMRDPVDVPF